jgi:hypothetical protein
MNKIEKQNNLLVDIKTLIEQSKQHVAVAVNATMTMLYWQIGNRIKTDVLQNKRAEYGQEIVKQLSANLTEQYGKGWSEKHLRHCLHIAETFPDVKIVYTLCRQLNWSHLRLLMHIDDPLEREFYIEMAKLERWSFRVLRDRVQSMLYERTAISKKPEDTIIHDLKLLKNEQKLTPDLVFQVTHLRWLDKNMRLDGENSPIGLILCAGKSDEHIELLQLENSNIKVADYLTQLPDKKLLEQKLRTAIEIAKKRLEAYNE